MTGEADRRLKFVLRRAAGDLDRAGIPDAMIDARILAAATLGLTREDMVREPDRLLSPDDLGRIEAAIARRRHREPVSRILGRREFMSLEFDVSPATLDPRPDSETVVETVLGHLSDRARPRRVLDLGAGTGCLLLALLEALPGALGVGIDISADACEVAATNARRLGLEARAQFLAGDWFAPVAQGERAVFDIVVSNPPYIPTSEIDTLQPEVRDHDPRLALDGGTDGLDAYRSLAEAVTSHLAPDGLLALEIGAGQADGVADLFARRGLERRETRRDIGGHPRCLLFSQAVT